MSRKNHLAPNLRKFSEGMHGASPLICASALAGAPQFVRENFGNRTLQEANRAALLDIERIQDQNCFIPHGSMVAFLDTVARLGGEPELGLKIAPYLDIRNLGIWSDYILGAPTLGAAISRAQRTIGFHSHGDDLWLSVGTTTASFFYQSASRGQPGYRHDAFATIGIMLSLCRCYQSDGWVPLWVELDLPRPAAPRVAETTFRCPVIFEQDEIAIVFMARDLNMRRRTDRTFRYATIEDVARARLRPGCRETLYGSITATILAQVLAGCVSIERAGEMLSVSTRSLQRQLSGEGTSFRDLVKATRLHRAGELLADGTFSVAQIADMLGYSTSAHFARAFRRETGVCPRQFSLAEQNGHR